MPITHTTRLSSDGASITQISHPFATIWLAREYALGASYFYGGTRLIDSATSDTVATDVLVRLMRDESSLKNRLINVSLDSECLASIADTLPPGFRDSRVGGARCVIRPRSEAVASSLLDPRSEEIAAVLESIGDTLNEQERQVKLTPDFGRNAGLADILHRYTPNVLGIACDKGGCGGKASYATSGVIAALECVARRPEVHRVTCIGSAGAMGSGVLEHFLACSTPDLGVCDLVYDAPSGIAPPPSAIHLRARGGRFTTRCLRRGGLIVATTNGNELEHSAWDRTPAGTALFLAHNLALPGGAQGIHLARTLHANGVLVIPGQVLTLGGALTARLEWYWRQMSSNRTFDKALAHAVVRRVVSHLATTVVDHARLRGVTPYEAMLRLAATGQ
jgi:hypothetical protein